MTAVFWRLLRLQEPARRSVGGNAENPVASFASRSPIAGDYFLVLLLDGVDLTLTGGWSPTRTMVSVFVPPVSPI